ncbi:MAG: hypothetical protein M1821_006230 [Bathelium mastoideum]|nr:MAG: hypothetical protein M1821_006230 [Bathelium mastoideum]KAI9686569.1 MAG: hypothetical protein M1822_003580 [Bathelium mastoideum]
MSREQPLTSNLEATQLVHSSALPSNSTFFPSSSCHRMTRSHKYTDRDHVGLADGTAAPEEHLPRYFAKTGHVDSDPKKTKKDGGGKANWGREGDELQDYGYNVTNPRRRSNSASTGHRTLNDFKTKFEAIETEPVFEESLHGPSEEDALRNGSEDSTATGYDLEKESTSSSADHQSVELEEEAGAGNRA